MIIKMIKIKMIKNNYKITVKLMVAIKYYNYMSLKIFLDFLRMSLWHSGNLSYISKCTSKRNPFSQLGYFEFTSNPKVVQTETTKLTTAKCNGTCYSSD